MLQLNYFFFLMILLFLEQNKTENKVNVYHMKSWLAKNIAIAVTNSYIAF